MNTLRPLIYLLTVFLTGIHVCSCSESRPPAPKQIKQVECIVWNREDSMAMELAYQTIAAKQDKARLLYDSIATIDHRLPGMFLCAGKLHELNGDETKATSYYRQEVTHDIAILKSDVPECRKHQFRIDLFNAYILLNDSVNVRRYAKILEKNGHYVPWPTRQQVLSYY